MTISNFDSQLDSTLTTCDLSSLKFIDAYGLVGLACALASAGDLDHDVRLKAPRRLTMRSHLAVMGFDDFLDEAGKQRLADFRHKADTSDVVVPLRSAADSGGEQAIVALLWEQLRDRVGPQILDALGEGVWEMVANALEHSGSDAFVMAQRYLAENGGLPPDHNDRIQVVIGDVGRGIRESLASSPAHDPGTDLEAIELALEYLVTSVHDDPGRGQGLSTTLEQVTELGGQMIVRSGSGRISMKNDEHLAQKVPPLRGTIIALSLPLYPG